MNYSSKKFIAVIIAISILIICNSGSAAYQDSKTNNYDYNDSNSISISNNGRLVQPFDKSQPKPVSITQVTDNLYAFVDYINVYFIELDKGNKLKRPSIIFSQDAFKMKDIFDDKINSNLPYELPYSINPTGIYYDKSDQTVYIANYNYHNILIGKIRNNFNEIFITGCITDPDMISPENVFVDPKNNIIAVADYDKNALFVFNKNGSLKWKKTGLKYSHGVTIYDNYIYLSLLGEVKLVKFDLNGNKVGEVKETGFGSGQYIYPTTLIAIPEGLKQYYNGDIMVVDPRAGKLTVIDRNLKPVLSFGTNGPEDSNFNLPYGLTLCNDKVIIGDTGKRRLVVIDPKTHNYAYYPFMYQINIGEKTEYGNPKGAYISKSFAPKEFTDYMNNKFLNPENKFDYAAGFQRIYIFLGKDIYTDLVLPSRTVGDIGIGNRPLFGFGFSWIYPLQKENSNYILIGSNDKSQIMVINTDTDFYDIVEIPEQFVLWGPPLVGHDKYFDMIANFVIDRFQDTNGKKYKDNLVKYNNSKLTAYVSSLYDNPTQFFNQMKKGIFTSLGNQLADKWLVGQKIDVGFKTYIENQTQLNYDEFYLLKLLSQTTKDDLIKQLNGK